VGRNQYCSCEVDKPCSILERRRRKYAKCEASWGIASEQVEVIDRWIRPGISDQSSVGQVEADQVIDKIHMRTYNMPQAILPLLDLL
jgi:hypothetical protein